MIRVSVLVEASKLDEQPGEDRRAAQKQGLAQLVPAGRQGDTRAQNGGRDEKEGER